jgi:hypothetical protein
MLSFGAPYLFTTIHQKIFRGGLGAGTLRPCALSDTLICNVCRRSLLGVYTLVTIPHKLTPPPPPRSSNDHGDHGDHGKKKQK